MAETSPGLAPEQHLRCGKSLFNFTWTLIEKPDRSDDDDDLMIDAAHASAYHWRQVGEPVNFARGHWQISRVYAVLGRAEPSLHHAQRCLDLCEKHGIAGFDLAFAHEALARAHAVAGSLQDVGRHKAMARRAAEVIAEEDDRQHLLDELASIRENA